MKEEDWYYEISVRCPWFRGTTEKNFCAALNNEGKRCAQVNCAPFFMAATIISAYKEPGFLKNKE